ncbi:hypothetical protein [Mesorhizobium sp. M0816]|uniref:hypothetical protein n=1 Tax=Mesorhizobium sp. M0816 TaxID=2957006 RepID=UPI00333AFA34
MAEDPRYELSTYRPEPRLLPPFEGPRLKVARAVKHLEELETVILDYGSRVISAWCPYHEPHYEHMILWELRFSEDSPQDAAIILGDAAHNLRAALDIMLCDIARIREKSTDKLKFLLATSAEEWEARLAKHPLKRLGPDVVQAVRNLAPNRDTNSALRALHDLDILDKHELVVLTFAGCWSKAAVQPPIWEAIPVQNKRGDNMLVTEEDMFLIRGGLELSLLPMPTTLPFPIFTHGLPQGSPFAGKPVLETLRSTAQFVAEVVEDFALKFGRRDDDASTTPVSDH